MGRNGIDGLYVKMDAVGNPRQLMVADAKVNTAQLGYTKEFGKQMSHEWIRPWLKKSADDYRNLAEGLATSKVQRVSALRGKNPITVQLDHQTSVEVWKTSKGYSYYSPSPNVTAEQIRRQAVRTSAYLDGAAAGKIDFRSRLFTYKAENGMHVLSIKTLDANGNVVRNGGEIIRGTFKELPKNFQRAIRHTAIQTLGQKRNVYGLPKYSSTTIKNMARKCCNDPEYFYKVCVKPSILPQHIRIAATIGSAAALTAVLDVGIQYATTGDVNWGQTAQMTCLAGTATGVGMLASKGVTMLGGSSGLASFVGGSIAGVFMAYGMYAMGYGTLEDANWGAYAGLASSAVIATPAAMIGIACLFGTASTGTAISSLSGAAMTNAALAWWGGGAIAAGGGGVAAGSTTLIVATGGVAIVVIAIPAVYFTWKHFSSVASQHRYLCGMIDIVSERLRQNRQVEWTALKPVE